MRIIAAFQKNKEISYISHLDIQRTLQRAFRRADLPLSYSNGFNPHPRLSFATALATGFSSDAEWIDVYLEDTITPESFLERVNRNLPNGLQFHTAFCADDSIDTLSKLLIASRYVISMIPDEPVSAEDVSKALNTLLAKEEIIVSKKTKSGIKPVNIRPEILEAFVIDTEALHQPVQIELLGTLTVSGGLRVETFIHALYEQLGTTGFASVNRVSVYFSGCDKLPSLE